MIVIKSENGKNTKVKYPGMWGEKIDGLDKSIKYYEIKEMDKPEFNPDEFSLQESIKLTENLGEFLNIAEIHYNKVEIGNVIERMNSSFGVWIDSAYPLYKRTNDASIDISEEGNKRIQRYKELREERQLREDNYINNNIFPSFDWEW